MKFSPSIDVHIGAHKTATTYIQRIAMHNNEAMAEHGLAFPHHRKVRKFLTVPYQTSVYRNPRFTEAELEVITNNFFTSLAEPGIKRVVISDENLPGHCGHVAKSGLLYTRKKLFLGMINTYFPKSPKQVFVGVRNYKDYFSSVYGQYLLDVDIEHFVPPTTTSEQVMSRYPSWCNFIKVVGNIFPKAQIVVWPYEGIGKHWDQIFGAIFGQNLSQNLDTNLPQTDDTRQSMSGMSFNVFRERLTVDGPTLAIESIREIRDAYDTNASAGKMNIFDQEQSAELDQRYKQHLEELTQLGDRVKVLYEASI